MKLTVRINPEDNCRVIDLPEQGHYGVHKGYHLSRYLTGSTYEDGLGIFESGSFVCYQLSKEANITCAPFDWQNSTPEQIAHEIKRRVQLVKEAFKPETKVSSQECTIELEDESTPQDSTPKVWQLWQASKGVFNGDYTLFNTESLKRSCFRTNPYETCRVYLENDTRKFENFGEFQEFATRNGLELSRESTTVTSLMIYVRELT